MLCGLPVMFSLLIAPSISLMIDDKTQFFTLLIGRMYKGIDNFPLMAIPFFILAGEMMNAGQITVNLVRLSQALKGTNSCCCASASRTISRYVRSRSSHSRRLR